MIKSITTKLLIVGALMNLQAQNLIKKTYGHAEDDHPFTMIQTRDGGHVLAGGSYVGGVFNGYLVKQMPTATLCGLEDTPTPRVTVLLPR